MITKLMTDVAQQSPSLAAIALLSSALWVFFKRALNENKKLLTSYDILADRLTKDNRTLAANYSAIIDQHNAIIEQHKKNADHYLGIAKSAIEDNERIRKSYDDIKTSLGKVMIENQALLRNLDRLEEMVRAVGGETSMIRADIAQTRKEVNHVSERVDQMSLIGPSRASK